jgi:hypothetical protein
VLVRLDAIQGVRESRADPSGRYFLLQLDDGADEPAVIEAALAVLRGRARRLDAVAAARQVAARERGDPWFPASEVHALSYVEGRIIAVRLAASVGESVELSPAQREALEDLARAVVFRAVERVHAEGGRESTGWFYEAWPEIARAVVDGSRSFLDADAHARAADVVVRLHVR